MNGYVILAAVTFLGLGVQSSAIAQHSTAKEQLVGTWTLVSSTVERDGTKVEPFGSNPIGYMIFTARGHFAWNLMRTDRPKFASGNRATGTVEENKAAVQGNISAFGTYTVDPDGLLTLHIVGSSFANWDGTTQKRIIEINGDQLKYSTPTASIGGSSVNILTRAK